MNRTIKSVEIDGATRSVSPGSEAFATLFPVSDHILKRLAETGDITDAITSAILYEAARAGIADAAVRSQ
jgi:hypothetical protein